MFSRNFIFVAGINFLILMPHYLLFVIIATYSAERFNTSASTGGLVAGLMVIGILIGRFFSGRFIGMVGSKKVLFFGLIEFLVTMALYFVVDSLPLLMLVRLLCGIGVGCVATVTGTLVAHITPPEQIGVGISYFSLSTILSMAAGPFLGVLFLGSISFSSIFMFCCGLGVLCFILSLFLTASIPHDGKAKHALTDFHLSEYIDRQALPISIVMLVLAQGYGSIQAFIASYAGVINLTETASLFFPIYAAVILLSRPFTGKILDRRGENVVVYPSLAILVCGLALLASVHSSWTFLFSAALIGAGFGNFQSTGQVISVKAVPRERIAQATSTFFIFLDLGVGCGPYLLGTIIPIAGYSGLFYAVAILTMLSMPLYFFLHGRKTAISKSNKI